MDFFCHIEEQYGIDVRRQFENCLSSSPYHSLLLNKEKISDEQFLSFFPSLKKHPFVKHAFFYDKKEYEMGKSLFHDAGAIYISDPSSLMVASILNASEDDVVLDLCAAPGGKTIQTSLLMKNSGLIIANDMSYNRALVLSQNIERMGRKNVICTSNDLTKIKGLENTFDKIILDAPCSGSGMFRKSKEMMSDWSYDKVLKQTVIQKELIELAYRFLAPSGYLIYSTCSYSKEENYQVIQSVLNNHPDLELVMLDQLEQYSLTPKNEGITLSPILFNGEGQYMCLLRKSGEKSNHKSLISSTVFEEKNFNNLKLIGNRVIKNDDIYLSPTTMNLKQFNVIRNGLKIGSINKSIFTPSHHLSHYLPSTCSITLSKDEAISYLKGQTIYKEEKKGYHVVSYNNLNLGFVKSSNGVLKNHYPKGLRHN